MWLSWGGVRAAEASASFRCRVQIFYGLIDGAPDLIHGAHGFLKCFGSRFYRLSSVAALEALGQVLERLAFLIFDRFEFGPDFVCEPLQGIEAVDKIGDGLAACYIHGHDLSRCWRPRHLSGRRLPT